jgi:hypothetical protein
VLTDGRTRTGGAKTMLGRLAAYHVGIVCLGLSLVCGVSSRAQDDPGDTLMPPARSEAAERLRKLSDPKAREEARKRLEKPAFDLFRTQIAPSDVVPYTKEGHWSYLIAEAQANHEDYAGTMRLAPVRLGDMPAEVVFDREARLVLDQRTRLGLLGYFPRLERDQVEVPLELARPDSIRADLGTAAYLMRLRPHQMLIAVLGPNGSQYARWNQYQAAIPPLPELDKTTIDRLRYYRWLHPQEAEKLLPLPSHPLAWTAISHVVWDGASPQALNLAQQESLVDWLHWGGQLIVVTGAGQSLAVLEESFLGPLLPAHFNGQNQTYEPSELKERLAFYPAPWWPKNPFSEEVEGVQKTAAPRVFDGLLSPLFVNGLALETGARPLHFGGDDGPVIGAEWRVGRGRVVLLGFRPTDAALGSWRGLDTFVRRVVLRRPANPPTPGTLLSGRDLSWVRFVTRDLGAPSIGQDEDEAAQQGAMPGEVQAPRQAVAAWLDGASLPTRSRDALMEASGIRVPPRSFIFRVILAYLVALVPANWLLCRFVLRKRELAWVLTPILALAAAGLVERAAAYDLGYDLGCDEIDVLELQPGYARAHLSRFGSLYSTGRVAFTLTFPGRPTAVALPMTLGADHYRRGEDVVRSSWQSYPAPRLSGLTVPPRSLSLFRAEAFEELSGGLSLERAEDGTLAVVNATGLEIHDAELVDRGAGRVHHLGTIAHGARVTLGASEAENADETAAIGPEWVDLRPFYGELANPGASLGREDERELRLVGWTGAAQGGIVFEPSLDRHRGVRLIVAHLDYGPGPGPDERPILAERSDR